MADFCIACVSQVDLEALRDEVKDDVSQVALQAASTPQVGCGVG